MTIWMSAVLALLPVLAVPVLFALCAGEAGTRMIAAQFATGITCLILTLLTFAFDQPSFIDLALALALLSLPGTLAIALFLERWI
jgi:multisubunit Na+/H+ antiporter MnhF subunit